MKAATPNLEMESDALLKVEIQLLFVDVALKKNETGINFLESTHYNP